MWVGNSVNPPTQISKTPGRVELERVLQRNLYAPIWRHFTNWRIRQPGYWDIRNPKNLTFRRLQYRVRSQLLLGRNAQPAGRLLEKFLDRSICKFVMRTLQTGRTAARANFIGIELSESFSDWGSDSGRVIRPSIDCGPSEISLNCSFTKRGRCNGDRPLRESTTIENLPA